MMYIKNYFPFNIYFIFKNLHWFNDGGVKEYPKLSAKSKTSTYSLF